LSVLNGEALVVSREESRLAKVVDIRRWREEKARQAKPSPAPPPPAEPRPRGLALTLGICCCLFGLGLAWLPFWSVVRSTASHFSLGVLLWLVLPAGLGIALLGLDLIMRVYRGRAGEGWYRRRLTLRRPAPGEEPPPRIGSWPKEL
jgi:hypothetical protein